MKFLLIAAAVVAVAVAGPTRFITPGGAGPAPILDSPISVGPALVEDYESPISVGPALVEDSESPISVGPAIVDEESPAQDSAPVYSSPLVQVIVNVNSGAVSGNPVTVEQPEIKPTPVIVVEQPEIEPTPVIVVEQPEISEPIIVAPIELPEIDPTPVIVVEEPEIPEPVIVAPIEVAPVITLPDELN